MLARLLEHPRSDSEWNAWSFAHRVSHAAIIQGLRQKGIASLDENPVDPIDFDEIEKFIAANQTMHFAMNAVLKLQNSDLGSVDFKDDSQLDAWLYLHFQQHYAAEQALASLPAKES